VIQLVTAWKVAIFVRNFASVVQIVQIGFQGAVVKRSATPSSAHVFWLYVNAIRIYAQNAVLISMMSPRLPVATFLSSVDLEKDC